jgi:hypothetical protein
MNPDDKFKENNKFLSFKENDSIKKRIKSTQIIISSITNIGNAW